MSKNIFSDFLKGCMQSFAGRMACLNVDPNHINADTLANTTARFRDMATALGQIYALRNTQVATLYKLKDITHPQAERLILRAVHSACIHETAYHKLEVAKFSLQKDGMPITQQTATVDQLARMEALLTSFTPYFLGGDRARLTDEEILTFDLEPEAESRQPDISAVVASFENTLRGYRNCHATVAQLMGVQDNCDAIQAGVRDMILQRAATQLMLKTSEGIHKYFVEQAAHTLECTANDDIVLSAILSLKNREVCPTCRNDREFKTHDRKIVLPCPTCRPAKTETVDIQARAEAKPTSTTERFYGPGGGLVGMSITLVDPPAPQNAATVTVPVKRVWASSQYFTGEMLKAARAVDTHYHFSHVSQGVAFNMEQTFLHRYRAAFNAMKEHPVNPDRPDIELLWPHESNIPREALEAIHQAPASTVLYADAATNMDVHFKSQYDTVIARMPHE